MQLQTQSEREPELNNKAEQLLEQAGRCEIITDADMRKAADLVKFIKGLIKQAEDDRKEITQPLMAAKRTIDDRYKAITVPLKEAESGVKAKMSVFHEQQEEKRRIEREREQREAEERALAAAESAETDDDQEGAEAILSQAGNLPEQSNDKPVRGDYGATASTRKRWVYEVEDIQALAASRPDLVIENAKAINGEIRVGAREIPGLKIYQKSDVVIR